MRIKLALGCWLGVVGLLAGAEPEPLVKVGDFHLKRARFAAAAAAEGDYVYVVGAPSSRKVTGSIAFRPSRSPARRRRHGSQGYFRASGWRFSRCAE